MQTTPSGSAPNSTGLTCPMYYKDPSAYRCPTQLYLPSGYAYNVLLDRRPTNEVLIPAATPMLFDSTLGVRHSADRLESFVPLHSGIGEYRLRRWARQGGRHRSSRQFRSCAAQEGDRKEQAGKPEQVGNRECLRRAYPL